MLSIGALAFAAPGILLALIALPILWWLLRITPPRPKPVEFPPLRLLQLLKTREETPAHTPRGLLLLRLCIAALVVIALAEPLLNPEGRRTTSGPLVLVIDDGWTAAPQWRIRLDRAEAMLERAEREGRPALLMTTAPPSSAEAPDPGKLRPAAELRPVLAALQPKPWATDREMMVRALGQSRLAENAEVVWIGDGLAEDGTGDAAYMLAEKLRWFGEITVIQPSPSATAMVMLPPTSDAQGDQVRLRRAEPGPAATYTLRSVSDQGRVLLREPITFSAGSAEAMGRINLPTELRNRLARLDIEEQPSAGATRLLDESWRRRPVGLISGSALESRQPLLADLFYLERALQPFAELRQGSVDQLLEREIATIVLADIGTLIGSESRKIAEWLDKGGVLLRFAGPRLAESSDSLLPVKLRQGARQLGGVLSWSQPLKLGAIPENGPLWGLQVSPEVTVSRQVLAEPEVNLAEKTWLRLEDGTPLVTAERRGRGWLILVHTTANTLWSDLALSGFFVDLLRRVVDLSQGVAAEGGENQPLPPLSLLDGFGRMQEPGPAVQALPSRLPADLLAGPRHPPGYYGRWESRRALNLGQTDSRPVALQRWPADTRVASLDEATQETRLLPWLLTAALILLLCDWVIGLWLRGLLPRMAPRVAAGLLLSLTALISPAPADAQTRQPGATFNTSEDFISRAASDLRLAYVITGDTGTDQLSRAGLMGLTDVLFRRTSIEAAEPIGVQIERDDISLLPFLYWPLAASQPPLSDAALKRLDVFMKTGGLILFDTRDQGLPFSGTAASPGTQKLRQLLSKLDVPPLMQVPDDHVLTKAFYLLREFPGRYNGGTLWVERNPGGDKDGVTSIVIGSNDWAAAWAIDPSGRPLAPTQPNTPRQREFAYRFGVNLLMYTLTGNYKADQVHIPALLERLGQ